MDEGADKPLRPPLQRLEEVVAAGGAVKVLASLLEVVGNLNVKLRPVRDDQDTRILEIGADV